MLKYPNISDGTEVTLAEHLRKHVFVKRSLEAESVATMQMITSNNDCRLFPHRRPVEAWAWTEDMTKTWRHS